jgi:hypothetical protein
MKTIKFLLSGMLVLTFFFGTSQERDGLYGNSNKQTIQTIKTLKPIKKQKTIAFQDNTSFLKVETPEKKKKTIKNFIVDYEVKISPVKSNQTAVVKLILKILGSDQKERIETLVKHGGTVAQQLDKTTANNMAIQLRELGVKVEVTSMKNDKTDSEYKQLVSKINDHFNTKTNTYLRKKLAILRKGTQQQNNREITRVAKKTGLDPNSINMMAIAEEKSAETGLPAQLYYAIYREASSGESTISVATPEVYRIKNIWENAIEENIIDASFEDRLNTYLHTFSQQKQITIPKNLSGRTRN